MASFTALSSHWPTTDFEGSKEAFSRVLILSRSMAVEQRRGWASSLLTALGAPLLAFFFFFFLLLLSGFSPTAVSTSFVCAVTAGPLSFSSVLLGFGAGIGRGEQEAEHRSRWSSTPP